MAELNEGLKGVVAAPTEICFIDGEQGVLVYAGINIHELARQASYEEVIFLLLKRRLPKVDELATLKEYLSEHREVPQEVFDIIKTFPKNLEPMASLRTAVSALSAFENPILDDSPVSQEQRVLQLIAKTSTLVAAIERLRKGMEPVAPRKDLSHSANFLYMLNNNEPIQTAEKAMDVALVLHAEHDFNASTFAARVTVSTLSDLYSGACSAIGALKGPLHGGANQRVMEMLEDIGSGDPVAYIEKALEEKRKIMGFGHRVYRTEDPRATHLREMSRELCEQTGQEKFFEMSQTIEKLMKERKQLNANVDFYSATVYHALGIATDLFTLIFALSRMAGWGAHMLEQLANNKLIRPRTEYIGPIDQHYIPIDQR